MRPGRKSAIYGNLFRTVIGRSGGHIRTFAQGRNATFTAICAPWNRPPADTSLPDRTGPPRAGDCSPARGPHPPGHKALAPSPGCQHAAARPWWGSACRCRFLGICDIYRHLQVSTSDGATLWKITATAVLARFSARRPCAGCSSSGNCPLESRQRRRRLHRRRSKTSALGLTPGCLPGLHFGYG
jgi:hypothetical protein